MKTLALVVACTLALVGCKKADKPAGGGSAGSAGSAMASSSAGSATAGSDTAGSAMAGSTPSDSTASKPASVTAEMIATADRAAVAIETLVNELDAAKADCKKALDVVKKHDAGLAALAKEVDAAKAVTETDPAAKEWMNNYMKGKLAPSVGKMMGVASTCREIGPALKANPLFEKKASPGSGSAAADDHKGHGH